MTNPELAINSVAKVTGVSPKRIVSRSREWTVVEARRLVVLILHSDGMSDLPISLVLNRVRPAGLKMRHVATDYLDMSKVFNEKFLKAKGIYEHEKSLRVS